MLADSFVQGGSSVPSRASISEAVLVWAIMSLLCVIEDARDPLIALPAVWYNAAKIL